MNFDSAHAILMREEGAYSNNPNDPGAETMYGITARIAVQEGYTGSMRALPLDLAKQIARRRYWDAVRAGEMPDVVTYPLFDAAYNSGASQAIKWLQRAAGVGEDGIVGPMTLAAVNRDPWRVAMRLNAYRLDFMTSLPTWQYFSRGWARRIATVMQEATA